MKKGTGFLALALWGSLLLSGCSSDSKVQIVEPKKTQEAAHTANGSVKEQVQAPEDGIHLICQNQDLRVTVSAGITVPDVEGMGIKQVTPRRFTDEDFKAIQEAVIDGGTILWDGYNYGGSYGESYRIPGDSGEEADDSSDAPRQALEGEEFSFEKLGRTTAELFQDKDLGKIGELESLLEAGWAKYQDSGDQAALLKLSGWESVLGGLSGAEEMVLGTEAVSLSELMKKISQYHLEWNASPVIGREDLYNLEYTGESMDGFYETEGLAYRRYGWWEEETGAVRDLKASCSDQEKALLEKCDALVERLGWKNVERAYSRRVYAGTEFILPGDDSAGAWEGVQAVYTRLVDQIPVTVTDQPGNFLYQDGIELSWPYEIIRVSYDECGLQSFQWIAPQTITSEDEESVFLLPFDEIEEIFEEMILSSLMQRGITGDVLVDEIRLGYMRVEGDKTEEASGRLVPVWDYLGDLPEDMAGVFGVNGKGRVSYMTINAMDGSIIMRG